MNTRAEEFIVRLLFRKWKRKYAAHRVAKFQVDTDSWAVGVYSAAGTNPFRLKKTKKHLIPKSGIWELPQLMKTLRNLGFKISVFKDQNRFGYHIVYQDILAGTFYDMR